MIVTEKGLMIRNRRHENNGWTIALSQKQVKDGEEEEERMTFNKTLLFVPTTKNIIIVKGRR